MSLSVVKEAKTKNRIQANLALWSEAGRATGVGQADNLELKSWLICRLPVSMLPPGTGVGGGGMNDSTE